MVGSITIGLCAVSAACGALLAIICMEAPNRIAVRRSWLDGYRAGHRAGRASLFPHRIGGEKP